MDWNCFVQNFKSNGKFSVKIKDYPPNVESKEKLELFVREYLKHHPFRRYTDPNGELNLVNLLTKNGFQSRDLSAKFYIASPTTDLDPSSTKAANSTGTHLDIGDAYNMLVNIGNEPSDTRKKEIKHFLKANRGEIGDDQLDRIAKRSVKHVGAVWHVFDREDADTICKYMQIRQQTKGHPVTSSPIHDQNSYLTKQDRKNLSEFGVKVKTIVQLLGDIVFIPAGSVHQVKNINSCIKIASDFVSPQSMTTIVKLATEFRLLPITHANTFDKLQVWHMLFQAIKNCVARK